MVLDGVSIEDRVVRAIAAVAGKPLAQKLEQALFFSAEVVLARARACARAASKRARRPLASVRGHLSARWPFQVTR